MFSKRVLLPLIALIPLMGASALVTAQEQCRPAVAQDFSSLSTACLDSDPNSLCLAQGDAVITRQGESEELAGNFLLAVLYAVCLTRHTNQQKTFEIPSGCKTYVGNALLC